MDFPDAASSNSSEAGSSSDAHSSLGSIFSSLDSSEDSVLLVDSSDGEAGTAGVFSDLEAGDSVVGLTNLVGGCSLDYGARDTMLGQETGVCARENGAGPDSRPRIPPDRVTDPPYTSMPQDIKAKCVRSGAFSGRRKVFVLSLDGGGIRGVIAARVLSNLESMLQEKTGEKVHLCDYFDLIAGTSTGAILTAMIATPDEAGKPLFTAKGCCDFYAKYGKQIFKKRLLDPVFGTLRKLYQPRYSPRGWEKLLKHYLVRNGIALTLRDVLKPILIACFDISQAVPFFFARNAALKDESRNFRLWEAIRATTAAPTLFPPAEITSVDGKQSATLVDGCIIQNNPALFALTHVLGNNEEFPEAISLQDVMILSLGAGQVDESQELRHAKKWGMTGWVRPLLNIMMAGTSDTVDYQLAAAYAGHNCSPNYLRIQLLGLQKEKSAVDCTSKKNIEELMMASDDLLLQQAVMFNAHGERVRLVETYADRLSWFADQLIAEKKYRDEPEHLRMFHHQKAAGVPSRLGPAARMLSPLFSHLAAHEKEWGCSGKSASFRI